MCLLLERVILTAFSLSLAVSQLLETPNWCDAYEYDYASVLVLAHLGENAFRSLTHKTVQILIIFPPLNMQMK